MGQEVEVKVTPLSLPHGPRATMGCLRDGAGRHALLESGLCEGPSDHWSYVAGPAVATLYTDAAGTRLERAGRPEASWRDPFEAIAAIATMPNPRLHIEGEPPPPGLDFVAGWVGVLGYDTARHLHRLPSLARADASVPDMWWMAVDQVLAFHHPSRRWWHCRATGPADAWPWTTPDRPSAWHRTLARAAASAGRRLDWHAGPLTQRMDRRGHEAGVRAIRGLIASGGCLQVNLTRRIDAPFGGDPWSLYRELAAAHPAPHGAYLEGPGFAVASCSPERFLKLREGIVQARPIKGTAPRGGDAAEDAARRAWLLGSEKNRAENLMIVDLMRNDLGRVAETGSVSVPRLFALEPYASVWQMVSTVEARLRAGLGAADLLRACWPPGSMTGAPKLAAMQAIEALEPTRRGFYAGSIGYLDCRGRMDLSVVIRSAVVTGDRVSVQVGGAIVADSDAENEWEESEIKGRRLLGVLGASSR